MAGFVRSSRTWFAVSVGLFGGRRVTNPAEGARTIEAQTSRDGKGMSMQDETLRPAHDSHMQDLAARVARGYATEHRNLAEACRAAADEDGIEVDVSGLLAQAEEWDAKAGRHQRSVGMIRRHINRARKPSAPPLDAVRPTAVATPRERRERRTSSPTRAGPDDDSESSEPPPRRLCAFCGKRIPASRSPKATHCTDKHADRDRQRRKRARDRARSKLPPTPQPADYWRMWEITDADRRVLWALAVCRCNGHHIELEPGWCSKCGHLLPAELTDGAERYAAFVNRPPWPRAARAEVA
jgi:hypothetical protein